MYKSKKIQQLVLVHFRRVVSLLVVFSLFFFQYVSASPHCLCYNSDTKKSNTSKKMESCCSSKNSEKQQQHCPLSDVEKSTHDCDNCADSCIGHFICSYNKHSVDAIPIDKIHLQKYISDYFLTSYLFHANTTEKEKDHFSDLNELYNHLCKLPQTIPLRI